MTPSYDPRARKTWTYVSVGLGIIGALLISLHFFLLGWDAAVENVSMDVQRTLAVWNLTGPSFWVGLLLLLAGVVLASSMWRGRPARAITYVLYDIENQGLSKIHAADFARFLAKRIAHGTVFRLAFYRKNQPDAWKKEPIFRRIAFTVIAADDEKQQAVDRRIMKEMQQIVWRHPRQDVHVVLVTTDQDYEEAVKTLIFMNYRVSVWAKSFEGRTSEVYQRAGAATLAFGQFLSAPDQRTPER